MTALLLSAALAAAPAGEPLEARFTAPPAAARPWVFWFWIHENVTREGITADLEAMRDVGIGGALIMSNTFGPRGDAAYLGDQWRTLVVHAVREAERLGLELDLTNCDGWSSSGGPWVTPERAMQMLVWGERQTNLPRALQPIYGVPYRRLGAFSKIAVLAFPTPTNEAIRLRGEPREVFDRDAGTGTALVAGPDGRPTFDVRHATPRTLNQFRLVVEPAGPGGDGEILASADGTNFRRVGTFRTSGAEWLSPEWQVRGSLERLHAVAWRVVFPAGTTRLLELELLGGHGDGVIPLDSVVDVTDWDRWDLPDGEWTFVLFGHTPIGKENHPASDAGRGLEVDKLSRPAVEAHFDAVLGRVLADLGGRPGALRYAHVDSYEIGPQNWTPGFEQAFERLRGYRMRPWLPALTGRVVGSAELTARFRRDVERTIADLWEANYYGAFAERCRAHGIGFSTEAYGPFVADSVACARTADMPMGEFWFGAGLPIGLYLRSMKVAAGAAHLTGRTFVGAEAYTAGAPWDFTPANLKALGDRGYTSGVNRYIFHNYAHQPHVDGRAPGVVWPNGIHLTRNLTWWRPGRAWFGYLARCQGLLQQGSFVADVLAYSGQGPAAGEGQPLLNDSARGYDLDVADTATLLALRVEAGALVTPSGQRYRLLALPAERTMTPALLRCLRDLVTAGAVLLGPRPERSPSLTGYPACDAEVRELADELWGDCDGAAVTEHRLGAGRVFWGPTVPEALARLGVAPDVTWHPANAPLAWIHRRADDAEIYFVACDSELGEAVEVTFRAGDRAPELWHPDTGRIEPAPLWRRAAGGRVTVPLALEPAGSVFVVFRRRPDEPDRIVAVTRGGQSVLRHAPKQPLTIHSARYGVQSDPARILEVTDFVRSQVVDDTLTVPVWSTLGGDPAPGVVKELVVEYTLGERPGTLRGQDGATLRIAQGGLEPYPAAELRDGALVAWEAGGYELTTAPGDVRRLRVESVPAPLALAGPWRVRFDPRWGGPAEVTLPRLVDWAQHPDPRVRDYSGTAEYRHEFQLDPALLAGDLELVLDLGQVRELAEVTLNGVELGVLWKPPFRVPLALAARPGVNELRVRVTNQWTNRLIADAGLPAGRRLAWTTFNPYTADSPRVESGLLGPVTVRAARRVALPPERVPTRRRR